MADDQENNPGVEEELDIDALLDEVAGGGGPAEAPADEEPAPEEGADEVAAEEEPAPVEEEPEAPVEEAPEELPDAAEEEVVESELTRETIEEEAVAEEVSESPAAAAPVAESNNSEAAASLEQAITQLNQVVQQVQQSAEKGESASSSLDEQVVAGQKVVKGLKQVSKQMEAERPSAEKAGKFSMLGMAVGAVTLLVSGAVLGLIVTEDKQRIPSQIEMVGASVDGLGEHINLIANRLFEQQQQMDAAMEAINSLKSAGIPAAPAPAVVEEYDDVAEEEIAPAVMEVAVAPEVNVDLSGVEQQIGETQQKIAALHELMKQQEGQMPALQKLLEQLQTGQQKLRKEQEQLLLLQQEINEKKSKGSYYKFP